MPTGLCLCFVSNRLLMSFFVWNVKKLSLCCYGWMSFRFYEIKTHEISCKDVGDIPFGVRIKPTIPWRNGKECRKTHRLGMKRNLRRLWLCTRCLKKTRKKTHEWDKTTRMRQKHTALSLEETEWMEDRPKCTDRVKERASADWMYR